MVNLNLAGLLRLSRNHLVRKFQEASEHPPLQETGLKLHDMNKSFLSGYPPLSSTPLSIVSPCGAASGLHLHTGRGGPFLGNTAYLCRPTTHSPLGSEGAGGAEDLTRAPL